MVQNLEPTIMGHSLELYRGHLALEQGESVHARQRFTRAGEDGDPRGWYLLGVMLSQGDGGPADPAQAAALYRRAAELGWHDAAYNLAVLYAQGRGVTQDFAQARRWYLAAAEAHDLQAQHMVGVMCARGEGGEPDFLGASRWWGEAASRGHAESMLFLAHMYLYGDGMAIDTLQAARWYLKSALAKDPQATPCLLAMRPALDDAIEEGQPEAHYILGRMAEAGLGQKPSPDEAERHYLRAVALHHPLSCRALANLYRASRDDARVPEILRLYRLAAEGGDAEAQHSLGFMYAEGLGITEDFGEALRWFRAAAAQGLVFAQADLSVLILDHYPDHLSEGLHCLEAAARAGLPEALLRRGIMLLEGISGPRDSVAGAQCLLRAIESRVQDAREILWRRRHLFTPAQLLEAERQTGGDAAQVSSLMLELIKHEGL